MPNIYFPKSLQPLVGNNPFVPTIGQTVAQSLRDVVENYPEIEPHIYKDGTLGSSVSVFVNDKNVRDLEGIDTAVTPDDRVRVETGASSNDT